MILLKIISLVETRRQSPGDVSATRQNTIHNSSPSRNSCLTEMMHKIPRLPIITIIFEHEYYEVCSNGGLLYEYLLAVQYSYYLFSSFHSVSSVATAGTIPCCNNGKQGRSCCSLRNLNDRTLFVTGRTESSSSTSYTVRINIRRFRCDTQQLPGSFSLLIDTSTTEQTTWHL